MKSSTSDAIDELTLAEASAWLTRLQESGRPQAIEAAFREWLVASPTHARAFARVNEIWDLIPGAVVPAHRANSLTNVRTRNKRYVRRRLAAFAVLLLTVVVVLRLLPADRTYETAVGALQTVKLDDSTRVTLNTGTRLKIAYRTNERRIVLEHGEALFEVAKNPRRPFVVQTGNEQIVALGTTFDVRRDPAKLAVTLIEGKVQVSTQNAASNWIERTAALEPGDRLTLVADGAPTLDRPEIGYTLAWQHGQIYFDDSTLRDAVAELNRYGSTRIRFSDSTVASLRISGVFSTRDPAQFASAVASLHGLRIVHEDTALKLTR
jgi:transmembrane sensor